MPSSEKIIVDSYAWIEYFRGSKEGEKAKEFIEGNYILLTPTVVIAELSDKYRREGKSEDWEVRRHFIRLKSDIIELEYKTADRAGKIKQELLEKHQNVGLADAIILTHSEVEEGRVLTGDEHLRQRERVIDISSL